MKPLADDTALSPLSPDRSRVAIAEITCEKKEKEKKSFGSTPLGPPLFSFLAYKLECLIYFPRFHALPED